jgi:hypothetical protein
MSLVQLDVTIRSPRLRAPVRASPHGLWLESIGNDSPIAFNEEEHHKAPISFQHMLPHFHKRVAFA